MFIKTIQAIFRFLRSGPPPVKNKKVVIYLTNRESFSLELINKFYQNIKQYSTLDEITWKQILFRRIRFVSAPNKSLASTTNKYWKYRFIKWFCLPISNRDMVNFFVFELFIFENFPNIIITPAQHVAEIYAIHLPHFKVIKSFSNIHTSSLLLLLKLSGSVFVNRAPGITVFTNPINETIIKAYKKLHPNKKIILRFHDKLDLGGLDCTTKQNIKNLIDNLIRQKIINEVESYYLDDAKYLNCRYRPNGVNPLFMKSIAPQYRTSLVYFLGATPPKSDTIKKMRLQDFEQIRQKILEIYPGIPKWISINQIAGKDSKWLSYTDYAKRSSKSEIFVDLFRVDQNEGFSYRIPEALFLNRKIITNRIAIKNEIFYDKNRIFIIGIDPLDRLQTFFESPIKPLSDSVLKFYDSTLWWTDKDPILEKPMLSDNSHSIEKITFPVIPFKSFKH